MSILVFDPADVLRVCEHATTSPTWTPQITDYGNKKNGFKPTYGTPEISVSLVHDHGVYLMSNGNPRDLISGTQEKGSSFCAYARGMNPSKDGDSAFDAANDAVGGDDFGEHLGAQWVAKMLATAKAGKPVRIRMSANKMELAS